MIEVMELERRISPSADLSAGLVSSARIEIRSPILVAEQAIGRVGRRAEEMATRATEAQILAARAEINSAFSLLGRAQAMVIVANTNLRGAESSAIPANARFFADRAHALLAEAARLTDLASQQLDAAERAMR